MLGVGQVLPGANTVNVAVMIGDRFQGPVGACVSVLALMAMPLAILIVLASLYAQLWMNDTAFTSFFCDFASRAGFKCSSGQPDRLAHSRVCGTRDCNSCDDPSLIAFGLYRRKIGVAVAE